MSNTTAATVSVLRRDLVASLGEHGARFVADQVVAFRGWGATAADALAMAADWDVDGESEVGDWYREVARIIGGEEQPAVTPASEVVRGGDLCLAIARLAGDEPGAVEAWMLRPMRDGRGRVVRELGPVRYAEELVSF